MIKTRWFIAALLMAVAALPSLGSAQTRGTISGQVTDTSDGQPLANVQIFVQGTSLGTLSNADGNFTIREVPPGQHQVRANRLGYSGGDEIVTVIAGETATVNFGLSPSAVALEEIVVTGTAGAVERRAQPAVVATINAAEEVEQGTSSNLSQLLTAQVPGVQVTASSGVSGTAQQIRIRGASSITLSNEPLIFIDGIRANSRTMTDINIGGQGVSRLFDINPEDIQSIEIVKGPAAATLYGADASAGVIQIFTKQGRPGSNRFTQNISLEYNNIDPNFTPPANFGACSEEAVEAGSGVALCQGQAVGTVISDNPLVRNDAFEDGHLRSLGYSGRGGGENYGYFVSLGYDDEEGTLPNNSLERRTGRVNFNFIPTSELSIDAGIGLGLVDSAFPINDNNIFGFLGGGLLGRPTSVSRNDEGELEGGFYIPQRDLEAISSIESEIRTLRYTPTLQVNYTPMQWFTNRVVMGADISRTEGTQFYPKNEQNWYSGDTDSGDLEEERVNFDVYTFDYLGTLSSSFGAESEFSADFSFGLQAIQETFDNVVGYGTGFVTNANRVVGDASQISAGQDFQETTSLGYLGQLDVGLWDRLFLQIGARVDQFSSFGEQAEPFFLPKVGASYVISDESFWQPVSSVIPTLRLRGAYGTTGRAPSAGASLETYNASPFTIIGGGTGAGVRPARPGNFDLRPEKGTEYELGLDAGLFNQRFGLELTYYNKHTTDLILNVPIPPSSGFSSNPFENIGEVLNSGIELALNGQLVSTPAFSWDFRVAGSTLHNELIELGEVAPFGNMNRFIEGYPLGAFFTQTIQSVDVANEVVVVSDTAQFVGNYLPDFEGNVGTTFTIMQNLQISGQMDWKSNFMIYNNTAQFRDRAFRNSELGVRRNEEGFISEEERLRRYGPFVDTQGQDVAYTQVNEEYLEEGDFVRLREIAATLSLPEAWAQRMGASAASLTVGGRNLAIWTDYSGPDPEVLAQATRNTGTGTFQREDFLTVPQPRRMVFKLNLTF